MSVDDTAPALPRLTPGEVPAEEFVRPPGLKANAPASEPGVPRNRSSSIVNGSPAMTMKLALLLEQRFGIGADLWMSMRPAHGLPPARDEKDT